MGSASKQAPQMQRGASMPSPEAPIPSSSAAEAKLGVCRSRCSWRSVTASMLQIGSWNAPVTVSKTSRARLSTSFLMPAAKPAVSHHMQHTAMMFAVHVCKGMGQEQPTEIQNQQPLQTSDSPLHVASRCTLSQSCRARALRSAVLLPGVAPVPSSCCSALQSLKSAAARALPACLALAAGAWGSALGRLPPDSPEPAGEGPAIVAGEAPASCWTSSLLHLKAAQWNVSWYTAAAP